MQNIIHNIYVTISLISSSFAIMYIATFYIYIFIYLHIRKKSSDKDNKFIKSFWETHDDSNLPKVVVHLPVLNEDEVIARLLKHVTALDYPKHLLEIYIVDDSTPESKSFTRKIMKPYIDDGYNIKQITRNTRKDFKAGQLQNALSQTAAEYIVCFDADFMPKHDFIRTTLPYLINDPSLACVQTDWDGYSEAKSLIAKSLYTSQIVVLVRKHVNAYFGGPVFFVGSSSILRRTAIEDAGGWQGDTLAEDTDLATRLILKGWKSTFVERFPSCEWPETMYSAKQQQGRWACGGTHVMRKYFKQILNSKLPFLIKCDIFINLSVFLLTLLSLIQMLITWPLLSFYHSPIAQGSAFIAFAVIMTFLAVPIMLIGKSHKKIRHMNSFKFFIYYYFYYSAFTVYLAFYTVKGAMGIRGDFFKVPKLGGQTKQNTNKPPIFTRKNALFFFLEIAVYIYLVISVINLTLENFYIPALGQFIFLIGFSYGLYCQIIGDRLGSTDT